MKNQKSSILLVGNHLSSAGFNPGICETLAVRLRQRGWEVLTTSARPRGVERLADMVKTAWLSRHEYDLAHIDVYSGRAFVWAEAVARVVRYAHKPYVVTLRGGNLVEFARRWPRRVSALLGSAAAVTTPSRFLFESFRSAGLGSGVLRLIPNALDVNAYGYRPRTAARPRLLWLRAFHRIYQPEMAVDMLAGLVQEFPDIQLTMAGPDKGDGSFARTRQLAERRGITERVAFPGAAPKASLRAFFESGDVFLNTARVDNTPVSVLEAMAGGLCIVSTQAGGLPYLLHHERDALLINSGHPREMAAAVRRLLRQPRLAEELSRTARRNVEPYDWSEVLPLWEQLFLDAASYRETHCFARVERRTA